MEGVLLTVGGLDNPPRSFISFLRQTKVLVLKHRSFLGTAMPPPAALPVGLRPPSRAAGGNSGGKPCTSAFPHIAPIALAKNGEDRYTYYLAENLFRPIRKLLKI